ncbi:MAG: helix-turn-helix transcriptional regulator [Nitrospirae bacterium]|nr:helix-turn-helix transcriptional regulator [Nitrospirota bacterium]
MLYGYHPFFDLCNRLFIGEIERGEVNPSLESLIKISKPLGVKVGDLFPREVDIFPQFSPHDLQLIKKVLRLLNRTFSKV